MRQHKKSRTGDGGTELDQMDSALPEEGVQVFYVSRIRTREGIETFWCPTTALYQLAHQGNIPDDGTDETECDSAEDLVHILVERGSEQISSKEMLQGGTKPLILQVAAYHNSEEVAIALLECKAWPNPVDAYGATPLMSIASIPHGSPNIVECLLEHKASVAAQDLRGNTALHRAFISANAQVSEILVASASREILRIKNSAGETPSSLLKKNIAQYTAVVERLMQPKEPARPRAKDFKAIPELEGTDESGTTLLMDAAGEGDMAEVESLVINKADIEAQNKEGETSLMYAAHHGHKEIIDFLLKAGADPNVRSKRGTALTLVQDKLNQWKEIEATLVKVAADRLDSKRPGPLAIPPSGASSSSVTSSMPSFAGVGTASSFWSTMSSSAASSSSSSSQPSVPTLQSSNGISLSDITVPGIKPGRSSEGE